MIQPLNPPEESPSPDHKLSEIGNLEEAADPALDDIDGPTINEPKEELLTIIVEIGDGREEPITVYAGDRAEELAERFARKHKLDTKMRDKLTCHIQENINQALIDIALEDACQQDETQDHKEEKEDAKDPDILEEEENQKEEERDQIGELSQAEERRLLERIEERNRLDEANQIGKAEETHAEMEVDHHYQPKDIHSHILPQNESPSDQHIDSPDQQLPKESSPPEDKATSFQSPPQDSSARVEERQVCIDSADQLKAGPRSNEISPIKEERTESLKEEDSSNLNKNTSISPIKDERGSESVKENSKELPAVSPDKEERTASIKEDLLLSVKKEESALSAKKEDPLSGSSMKEDPMMSSVKEDNSSIKKLNSNSISPTKDERSSPIDPVKQDEMNSMQLAAAVLSSIEADSKSKEKSNPAKKSQDEPEYLTFNPSQQLQEESPNSGEAQHNVVLKFQKIPAEDDNTSWQIKMEQELKGSMKTAPSINQKSKKISSARPLTELPVHERLHMQAVNKQKALKHSQDLSKWI